jgi:hypothetical protein
MRAYLGGQARNKLMQRSFLTKIVACVFLVSGWSIASDLNDFKSDGCSLFPNGTPEDRYQWCDCCFNHDIAYWRGGTEDEREEADQALQACVLERTKSKALADTMYYGVRFGGSSAFPTWYRWGYGWNYGMGDQPLTEKERKQADEKLDSYRKSNPEGYCRKE